MLTIRDHSISTIGVVDDSQQARQARRLLVRDSGFEMYDESGPLLSSSDAAYDLATHCQALICDHHLNTNAHYASFLGAELVARAVQSGLPSILCTRYINADIVDIRPYLPQIPVVISPQQLRDPDDLRHVLDTCIAEMNGDIAPERRRWRAQLVVEEIADNDIFFASIPGWDTDQVIRLRRTDVPGSIRDAICVGFRTYVRANLGEERPERFFVTDWLAQ